MDSRFLSFIYQSFGGRGSPSVHLIFQFIKQYMMDKTIPRTMTAMQGDEWIAPCPSDQGQR